MSRNRSIRLVEKTLRSSDEIGGSGTQISSGQIYGIEHNSKLTREAMLGATGSVGIIQRMRRTNPQIQALSLAIKLPIIGADWTVRPATVDGSTGLVQDQAEGHAASVARALFETPDDDWRSVVRQGLLHIDFGFMLFEPVYQVDHDGSYVLRRIAPRLPQTIDKWIVKNRRLAAVQQTYLDPETSRYRTVEIEAGRLVLITHEREGDNYEGSSLYRPIWAINEIKTMLLKLLSIAFEREALGIPIGVRPEAGSDATQDDDVESLLKNLRAHQKSYGILPTGWSLEWYFNEGGSAAREAIITALRYLDEQTLGSGLAQFLGLGSTSSGSRAVASEHTDLFYLALRGIAMNLSSAFNGVGLGSDSGLIRKLTALNFGEQRAYPWLDVENVKAKSLAAFAEAMTKLGGFINSDDVVEEYVRAYLGVPATPTKDKLEDKPEDKPEDTAKDKPEDAAKDAAKDDEEDPVKEARDLLLAEPGAFAFIPPRPLVGAEVHVRFAEIAMRLDTAPEDMTADVLAVIDVAIEAALPKIRRAIKAEDVSRLPKRLPGLAARIREVLGEGVDATMTFGAATVHGEVRRQRMSRRPAAAVRRFADPDETNMQKRLKLRREALGAAIDAVAEEIAAAAEAAVKTRAIAAIRSVSPSGISVAMFAPGSIGIRQGTVGLTATALNLSRDQAAAALNVEQVQFSSIMDARTCAECSSADQRIFDFGSLEHAEYECPYLACAGGGLCRCILIYLGGDES